MEDDALVQLLRSARANPGLGCARVLALDGAPVFTKSLPLTRREYEAGYSTENLFGLPSFFHYGVGSAGFGAFRELAVHKTTTRWVVEGELDAWPLLFHCRVLPIAGDSVDLGPGGLKTYIEYWDSNQAIGDYMLARQRANHQLVLFLEYVPGVLLDWLPANLDKVDRVVSRMNHVIEFQRERGLGHFDFHAGNILTDGSQVLLTDFGLAMDEAFALDADERAFLATHRYYDAGEFVRGLYRPVREMVRAWNERTEREVCARHGDTMPATVIDNLEGLEDTGALRLPAAYRETLRNYREVIVMMDQFFAALRRGRKCKSTYDDEQLRRALEQSGWRFPQPADTCRSATATRSTSAPQCPRNR